MTQVEIMQIPVEGREPTADGIARADQESRPLPMGQTAKLTAEQLLDPMVGVEAVVAKDMNTGSELRLSSGENRITGTSAHVDEKEPRPLTLLANEGERCVEIGVGEIAIQMTACPLRSADRHCLEIRSRLVGRQHHACLDRG
ncbi:MAG: hypothetical protein VKI83_11955 [Synechococcaceae cyanobacterium]|nr:hypothetical protein [Synechococcaceae cyanobacterium]